jgi:carbon-monoxide dehydrogenase iron sulfur subunit
MHRSPDDVVTNVGGKHACIACGMCAMMCPFGMIARGLAPDGSSTAGAKVMALKCDLCPEREAPACAAACPTGAIVFMEGDEFAHHSRLRASLVLSQARAVREATLVQAQEE